MPRGGVYLWELVSSLKSDQEIKRLRDIEFCCSKVTHSDSARPCAICETREHLMTEQRLQCVCKQVEEWQVFHSGVDPIRDEAVEYQGRHSTVITEEMKRFILQQDNSGIAPQQIWSNLRSSDIVQPHRGYPTLPQVSNCVKYLRRLQGTKNCVSAIKEVLRQHCFNPTGDLDKAFCFGPDEDESGFPKVGRGTDDDSFVVGISSRGLIDTCLDFASASRYTLFHADATFKLSDLGYPVITCGFSDSSRSYQLATIFVVSRRTYKEYSMCLSALVKLVRKVRPSSKLHIDAVMGDAEDAQLNGFQQVPEFSAATYLMCFFHVLYNVRKRTKHFLPEHRKAVMDGIICIHYVDNMTAYYAVKEEVLASWKKIPQLQTFTIYFTDQWLESRYWRWQVFHTPCGYATTNNPCETFNATLKKYTGRRRYYMQRLLSKCLVVVRDTKRLHPTAENQILQPSTTLVKAASALVGTDRVEVYATENAALCRVKHIYQGSATQQPEPRALEEFCCAVDGPFVTSSQAMDSQENDNLILGQALLVREERVRAAKLYDNIVSWSLQYAHVTEMPETGWIVDVDKCICTCHHYVKFKMCAHIIIARKAKRLGRPGVEDKNVKLFNRQVRKVSSAMPKQKKKKTHGVTQETTAETALPLTTPLLGRPPLASRAMDVQFILCPDT